MFGKNPIEKPDVGNGTTLRLVQGSPFYTIQGEGPYSGMPAVFLRLHGCNLACYFCDTEFSDPKDPTVSVEEIVKSIKEAAGPRCRLLVITGGEPVRQNLSWIIHRMKAESWTVQVETAGTLWQEDLLHTTIVCSPKTPKIHPRVYETADVFKYVIRAGETSLEDGLPTMSTQRMGEQALIARPRPGAPVYLSPQDDYTPEQNAANVKEMAQVALRFGYRAGLQVHKYLGLP